MGLVQQDQQGLLNLTCPTCRQITPVPASGVVGLQSDFRINQLLEVVDENWKETTATSFEEVVVASPTITPYCGGVLACCPEHDGKEMELYCETCGETICWKCAIKGGKHWSHEYEEMNEDAGKRFFPHCPPLKKPWQIWMHVVMKSPKTGKPLKKKSIALF